MQRRILNVLFEHECWAIETTQLKRLASPGGGDRSNLRRAIRGLLKRHLVEETRLNGGHHLGLTSWGRLWMSYALRKARPDPLLAELRREQREFRKARAEIRARREAQVAEGPPWWIRYEHRFARRRLPGEAQKRILAVLWEYAEPVEEGLAIPAVKAILGGDRANARRAIRTLLLRGEIEESEDGRRIRLTFSSVLLFSIVPPILLEPIDEERAREILQAHQEGGRQVVS